MKAILTTLSLAFAGLSVLVPSAAAGPSVPAECTAVTPLLDYDPVGCAEALAEHVPDVCDPDCTGAAANLVNTVLAPTCRYQRTLYDDVLGGPFAGTACLSVSG